MSKNKKRYFGLDLLRMVGMYFVVGGHIWMMLGGYFGIPHYDLPLVFAELALDAFFVMSGFLIGTILLRIVENGVTIRSWTIFTVRRLLRIGPPYYICIAVLFLIHPPHWDNPWRYVGYLTYTQNLAWPMKSFLPPSWSLTVEEWFYLLFSLFSLVAAARWGIRGFLTVLVTFLVVPLAARACIPLHLPWEKWIRMITLLRLDAAPYGVLVAFLVYKWKWPDRYHRLLGVLGFCLTAATAAWWIFGIGSFAHIHEWFPRTFIENGFLLGMAFLFPWLLRLKCSNQRITDMVAWQSDITYPVYLIHWYVLVDFLLMYVHGKLSLFSAISLALLTIFGLAALSLHLIERPILARRPRNTPRPAKTV